MAADRGAATEGFLLAALGSALGLTLAGWIRGHARQVCCVERRLRGLHALLHDHVELRA